jgi:hypothetical protein
MGKKSTPAALHRQALAVADVLARLKPEQEDEDRRPVKCSPALTVSFLFS